MIDLALIQACAPDVAVETMQAIVHVESDGDSLAVNINDKSRKAKKVHPQDIAEAVRVAHQAMREGKTVDLGLTQVNSSNLAKLGYTVEQMFNPCTNLRAGAAILTSAYVGARKERGEGQAALRAALSAYNTGDFNAGFNNGYVALYYGDYKPTPVFNSAEVYAADPTITVDFQEQSHAIPEPTGVDAHADH